MQPPTPSTSTLTPDWCPARAITVQLTAKNIAFYLVCLAVVAGKPFRLTFDNKEFVVHNIAIFRGPQRRGRQSTPRAVGGPSWNRTGCRGPSAESSLPGSGA
jgi:hypothetical protein